MTGAKKGTRNGNDIYPRENMYVDYASIEDAQLRNSTSHKYITINQKFPVILHYVLSELEKDGLDHMISWQPHGRSFIVHDPKALEVNVLPLWFRQSKFSSFQRQLNIYGFKRIAAAGPERGGYYHEMFLRGKSLLAEQIPRRKIKGTGSRKPSSSENYPNFSELPPLPRIAANQTSPAPLTLFHVNEGICMSGNEDTSGQSSLFSLQDLFYRQGLLTTPSAEATYQEQAGRGEQEIRDLLRTDLWTTNAYDRTLSSNPLLSLSVRYPQVSLSDMILGILQN